MPLLKLKKMIFKVFYSLKPSGAGAGAGAERNIFGSATLVFCIGNVVHSVPTAPPPLPQHLKIKCTQLIQDLGIVQCT